MSIHLLRQGVRTCRLTVSRLSPSVHCLYSAQAIRALADPPSHRDHLEPILTPVSESSTVRFDNVPSSSITEEPRKVKARSLTAKTKNKAGDAESVEATADPLKPTRVDLYLASLNAAGLEPKLEDLERCRPTKHPATKSPRYAGAYNSLIDTLCRSFSKEQLRNFIELYGLAPSFSRVKRKKVEYAETIIEEQWKWPSLKAIEREKRDRTETVSELYPVTPNELFLILGRDGVDMLQLSMKYNVHISWRPSPLALRIEGVRASLKKVRERLKELKTEVVEETFQLPTHAPIPSHLVQRISRLAGAYIENIGTEGLIRVCARSTLELSGAKRLAARAATEVHAAPSTPLLAYLPVGVPSATQRQSPHFPQTYSLYPFLSSRELPWYVTAISTFRVRRVGEWLRRGSQEDVSETGGLAEDKGRILNVNHDAVSIREMLLSHSSLASGSIRKVKAIFGHHLYPTKENRLTLIPPLQGSFQFQRILDWIKSNQVRPTFVPSLPAYLMNSSPLEQRLVHRLIYRALLDPRTSEVEGTSVHSSAKAVPTTQNITFELVIQQQTSTKTDASGADASNPSHLSLSPHSWRSMGAELDLMLPDRSIDVRLSFVENTELAIGEQPSDLQSYAIALQAFLTASDENAVQPDPPLVLYRDGHTFVLHTSATIRQNVEKVQVPGSNACVRDTVQVMSESVLDLESNERVTVCEIVCSDPDSQESWTEFLRTCDVLSASYHLMRPPLTVGSEIPPSKAESRS